MALGCCRVGGVERAHVPVERVAISLVGNEGGWVRIQIANINLRKYVEQIMYMSSNDYQLQIIE